MIYDSARKAIASLTKKVTKKATSKKKSKDVGTSKRRRKDDTSEEEEEPDNPNDSDFDPTNEAASASFMVDEDEINQGGGNNADIIDMINYTAPRRQWNQREFAIARNDNAYNQPRDTHNLYFHTTVQEQAFFSSLMECTVFAHQRVDFDYLESKLVLAGVATKLENLGLKPFLQHRCDWNDTIIRQFYATYEMDFIGKKMRWMTGKSEYEATFAEFAAANHLNYEYFSDGVDVYNEDILENTAVFYEPGTSNATVMNWLAAGLRHHPAAINNIIRHTFMPKSGNKDKVREYYWNVINHIMHGTKFDVVKLILDQMICKKCLVRDSIYFAPYIMSLKNKAGFNGLCDMKHEIYRLFYNAKAFLNKPSTPYGQDAEAQNVAENLEIHASDDENVNVDNMGYANVDEDAHAMPPPPPPVHPMQPQCEPSAGYFDPYFANIQQSMNS
jgi:hypothetical protein